MGRSELEACIEQSIRQMNELDGRAVAEGVRSVHTLLLRLIQTNRGQLAPPGGSARHEPAVVDTSTLNTLSSEPPETPRPERGPDRGLEEFRGLQDRAEYNLATQLLLLLVRVANGEFAVKTEADELVVRVLQILQGVLLIHPRSRTCFRGKHNIRLLIDLLDPQSRVQPSFLVIIECVLMLVSLFIRNAENLRNFEDLRGVELICKLIKGDYSDGDAPAPVPPPATATLTWHSVRIKSLEFLFFYLIPEFHGDEDEDEDEDEPPPAPASDASPAPRTPATVVGPDGVLRRGMASKIAILKRFLNDEFVDGIVREFVADRPFGVSRAVW